MVAVVTYPRYVSSLLATRERISNLLWKDFTMGIFDKAKDLISENSDKAEQGIEKAGDIADQKTGGKYSDKIDKAEQLAKDKLDEQSNNGQ